MRYALIIAAGKQSRFKDELPKALAKVHGTCILDINIGHFKKYSDEVYVVCSYENEKYFLDYPHLTIHSGFGSGDAVLKALQMLPLKLGDTCFIAWGDSVQEEKLYKYVVDAYDGRIVVPCNKEMKPYVQIIEDKPSLIVHFSKFGESISEGYHDLSLFYGNANKMKDALLKMHEKYWKEDHYVHKHGDELEFLDIFNDMKVEAFILDMKGIKSYSFNTLEDLENINRSL